MTLRWVPGWNGLTEPEAVSYVAAVEAADGEPLEYGVAKAINDFVLGCKNDGIWDAIKASCILAGARTLNGALVPLVGAAPTKQGTEVDWNYNRVTGLQGNGTNNYLDSNRNSNSDPNSNIHQSIFINTAHASGVGAYIGLGAGVSGATLIFSNRTNNDFAVRSRAAFADVVPGASAATGFAGASRNNSSTFLLRVNNSFSSFTRAADASIDANHFVFARNETGSEAFTTARLSFYSIGESLDLEKLDNRVTRLMDLITYTQTAGLPDLATMDIDAAAYIGGGYRVGGTLS